jgi:parallel beta-helix repeat protein
LGNTAYNNGDYGIYLYDGCDGNDISGNIASNTITTNQSWGIFLSSFCDNNNISGNTAYGNMQHGISLTINCDDNIIMENTMHYNHQYGLIIDSLCYNNLIYLNDFKNQFNARDDGNSQWDNGAIGNHWDDYEGVDVNDDGIGDSPYNISGSAGSQDNFPIWEDGIDIGLLYVEVFDQVFSTANFNITFYVYNGFNEGIDFASIQLWWDDTEVSSTVQNLGGGFYFVSLDPITVAPGEDPILLKMSIYADGYEDLYYETYIAVDPIVIQKYDEDNGVPITPTWMILMIFLWTFGVPAGIIVLIIYLNKRRKRAHI